MAGMLQVKECLFKKNWLVRNASKSSKTCLLLLERPFSISVGGLVGIHSGSLALPTTVFIHLLVFISDANYFATLHFCV